MFDKWIPLSGQREFLNAIAPVKVLACGRRWGKSEVAARDVYMSAITGLGKRQIILAPSYDQSRLIFDRVARMLSEESSWQAAICYQPYPRIDIGGGFVAARSAARDGMFLRGHGADRVVIDEAAYVPEAIIFEVVMPMLADSKGQLVMVSTPCGKNHFYRTYLRGQQPNSGVWSHAATTGEHDIVSREFLESQRSLLTDRQFRTEYNAEFLENAASVFETEWLDKAVMVRFDEELEGEPCVLGVDWARYHDYTAVIALQGSQQACRVLSIDRFNGLSWAEQVERVADRARLTQVGSVLCDRTSIGDPLLEQLQSRLSYVQVEGVTFTSDSKRRLIDRLVLMLQHNRLQLLPDMDLLRELHHFEAEIGPTGGVKLNAAYGYHDDMVIALALAVAALPETLEPPRIRVSNAHR
ncbi:MAG: terminase family protein [bacterium]|jgi:hypothetical protein